MNKTAKKAFIFNIKRRSRYALYYYLHVIVSKWIPPLTEKETEELRACLRELTEGSGWQGKLVDFKASGKDVSILVSLPPKAVPSSFAANLKTVSSRYMRKTFPETVGAGMAFWEPSYTIYTADPPCIEPGAGVSSEQDGDE